jgi:hypothetical protein
MPLDSIGISSATRAAVRAYHDASVAWRAYEAARKRAHAALVKLGIFPDHEKHPLPVGTNMVVYSDGEVVITLTVAEPIAGINYEGMAADLLKLGIKPATLKRLEKKHRTETRPAHKFVSSLVA